jgi:uncharacterized protein (TIGR00725 family)
MGAGESASKAARELGERIGERIWEEGWVLLTGGRDAGVMAAAIRGAKRVPGSLTIGILPTASGVVAPGLDVAIFTGMGNARNAINVLSSHVVVVCGAGGAGTASEVALALKSGRPVVLVGVPASAERFYRGLGGMLRVARSDGEAVRCSLSPGTWTSRRDGGNASGAGDDRLATGEIATSPRSSRPFASPGCCDGPRLPLFDPCRARSSQKSV